MGDGPGPARGAADRRRAARTARGARCWPTSSRCPPTTSRTGQETSRAERRRRYRAIRGKHQPQRARRTGASLPWGGGKVTWVALSGPVRVRETRNGVVWCGFSRGVTYRDGKYNLLKSLYGHVSPPYGDPLQARGSFGGPEQRSASTSSARTASALSEGRTSTRWPPTAPAGARGRRRRRAAAADHGAPAPRSVADRPAIS
jgi:hypothetical protein